VHPSSFNLGGRFDSGWLVYHEKVATGKIYIHDCTSVTALALLLFGAEPQIFHAQHRVVIDTWIELRISPRTAVLFKALRKQLFELLEARIANLPTATVDESPGLEGTVGDAAGGVPAADVRAGSQDARVVGGGASTAKGSGAKATLGASLVTLPPHATKEEAQEAILASLVYLIGKGMELQADELAGAAFFGKKGTPRR